MKLAVTAVVAFSVGWWASQDKANTQKVPDVKIWQMADLQKQRVERGGPWLEFLRIPSMSSGIYELDAKARDGQQPHQRDELYYVAKGKAQLESEGKRTPVKTGSVIFVRKGADHRFVEIEEKLSLVVFFASSPAAKSEKAAR